MKARFLVLCAIALLGGLLPGFFISASPVQAAGSPVNLRGVDVYRENLTRLRTNSASDSARAEFPAVKLNAQGLDASDPLEEAPLEEAQPQIEQGSIEQGNLEQGNLEQGHSVAHTSPFANVTPVKLFSSLKAVTANSINSHNFSDKLRGTTTALQSMRRSARQPSATRQDPYAIIAAAQQQANPLKGKNPFSRDSISNKISISLPSVSLPRIQPSVAQAEFKKRTLKVKDQVNTQVKEVNTQVKKNLPALVASPRRSINQTIEDIRDHVRAALVDALSWTEQTAHNAAEQVK